MIFDGVTIVGPGRMGLAIGSALERAGEVRTLTYFGRHPEPPSHPLFIDDRARYVFGVEPLARDTQLLILAVPDEVVPELAFAVAAHGAAPDRCAAFHLSGALPTDVLGPLYEQGYTVGALHPMVNVPDRSRGADRLAGAWLAGTGSTEALSVARRLAAAVDARVLTVPAVRRPLYHAAVVMGASYVLPLIGLSVRLMERAGVSGDEALPALLSMLRDTALNVEEGGFHEALPDPLASGDLEAVSLHLRALDPSDQRLYAVLGLEMLRLAGDGLDPATRDAFADLFGRYVDFETTETGLTSS